MNVKDRKIAGEIVLIEPLLMVVILIFFCIVIFKFILNGNEIARLDNEVSSFYKEIVIGKTKETSLTKEVEPREVCEGLIKKQRQFWKSIEVENRLLGASNDEIDEVCYLSYDLLKIRFSEPIFKK